MVGFCGIINEYDQDIDDLSQKLIWLGSENLYNFSDENLKISIALHNSSIDDQPAEAKDGNVLLWIWGEIYGHDDGKEYRAKLEESPNLSNSEYCAKLLEKYGIDFIEGLNSNFSGITYNRNKKIVNIFTDRLSTHPVFYSKLKNGGLVFSTSLQSIANHAKVELEFNPHGLFEFFRDGRIWGTNTVLNNVYQLHPGANLIYDLRSNDIVLDVYWRPHYKPKNWSFNTFVDKFYNLLKQVLSEQTSKDLSYGLFLSGGTDSRLIASLIEKDVLCYHMREKTDSEARIARNIANTKNLPLKFLTREDDFYSHLLKRISPISNLKHWFGRGHVAVFEEILRKNSDCILIGQYADTILDYYIPKKRISIPGLFQYKLKFQKKFSNIEKFDEIGKHTLNGSSPQYFNQKNMENHIQKNHTCTYNNSIYFHGVTHPYSSLSRISSLYYYPLTNTYSFLLYYVLSQITLTRYPYLDNRIIDLSLKIPIKDLLMRDIVRETVRKYDRTLAKIPHPSTGTSLNHNFLVYRFLSNFHSIQDKIKSQQKPSGTWINYDTLIRESDLVERKLEEYSNLLEKCDYISKENVWKVYREHLNGKNNWTEINSLLTFLDNPITSKIIL